MRTSPRDVDDVQVNVGHRLRGWRERRHLSQMALALRAEVSTRHLSCVETGRAQPGRETILRIADKLEIPLRERNMLLMAVGFAPVFEERRFDDPAFDPIRAIVNVTLDRHKPFPAYVFDRHWNVVRSNGAVPELYEGVDPALMRPPVNVMWRVEVAPHRPDASPDRADRRPTARAAAARSLGLSRRRRPDGARTVGRAGHPSRHPDAHRPPLLHRGDHRVRQPRGRPLEEIALEVMHPADQETERVVSMAAAADPAR